MKVEKESCRTLVKKNLKCFEDLAKYWFNVSSVVAKKALEKTRPKVVQLSNKTWTVTVHF